MVYDNWHFMNQVKVKNTVMVMGIGNHGCEYKLYMCDQQKKRTDFMDRVKIFIFAICIYPSNLVNPINKIIDIRFTGIILITTALC